MAGKRPQKKYCHRADENQDQIFHHEFFKYMGLINFIVKRHDQRFKSSKRCDKTLRKRLSMDKLQERNNRKNLLTDINVKLEKEQG